MALLANLVLFFVFYLPLTLVVAIPGDFYVGRYPLAEEAYPIFYWIVVGWPLLLPSILFIPAAHIALGVARRAGWNPDRDSLRKLAVIALPVGLLSVHLLLWGTVVLSLPLLVSILIPGALLGWVARIPTPRRRSG